MAFPLLPSMQDETKVAFTDPGKWISSGQNTLKGLVDSLKVNANNQSTISSIPDVWARPLLVELILKSPAHLQHEMYVRVWRGILAIIALRKLHNFTDLTYASIDVPEVTKLKDDAPDFLKVLSRTIPLQYLEKQNDETLNAGIKAKIQVLNWKNRPLAILWPGTLVCPAMDIDKYSADRSVPWWGIDGLQDPTEFLSSEEKNSLYQWLEECKQHVPNKEGNLIQLLADFEDRLKESLGDDFKEITIKRQTAAAFGITGFCKIIDLPIYKEVGKNFLDNSQILLINQRGNKDAKKLLIMTPNLAEQWNVNESEIIVGGHMNASVCSYRGTGVILDHTKLGDVDLRMFNAEIHMGDEFFTDKIVIFTLGYPVFPNALNNNVYLYGDQAKICVALPIRKELLEYLTPEFIAEHTSIEISGKDILVELALPVGDANNPRLLKVSKLYEASKQQENNSKIVVCDSIPLVQVWPNIRMRKPHAWRAYYTFFETMNLDGFHMSPIYEGETEQISVSDDAETEIIKGSNFPEAFTCERIGKGLSGQDEVNELGLVLLDLHKVEEVSTQNSTCKIGIDFGTTNTTAYLHLDGNDPELIQFKNRKFNVTATEVDGIAPLDAEQARRHFIPEEDQPAAGQSSIKTMFHANPERITADAFFTGNIYCLSRYRDIDSDGGNDFISNIQTNTLKWNQSKNLVYTESFLKQLCLQCLVEGICTGASNFEWMYSFPKSFTQGQLNQYKTLWTNSLNDTMNEACTLNSLVLQPMSESESVAEYFSDSMDASFNRGIICVDIGGGSSDIAIWQGKKDSLVNQTSIRFAGRDILNEYLWNRQKNRHFIFSQLKNDDDDFNASLNSLEHEKHEHTFYVRLEALLREYEQDIFNRLPSKMVDPELHLLSRDIAFALGGIYYYCGMLLGYLRKNGAYDQDQLLPNFYIGGNASKLMNWVAGGKYEPSSDIATVFQACFAVGLLKQQTISLKEVEDIYIKMTKHPKQEVAYGLVTGAPSQENETAAKTASNRNLRNMLEATLQKSEPMDEHGVLAGETITIDKQPTTKDVISAEDFQKGIRINNRRPDIFCEYLAQFNKFMENLDYKPILLTSRDYVDICTQVNSQLSDIQDEAEKNIKNTIVEPIFILVLKEAYKKISNS